MTPQEFFWLVARVRSAQTEYFKTRDKRVFRACRALETELDKEIERVRTIQMLNDAENRENAPTICRDCVLFGNCNYVGQAACPKKTLLEMNEYR